MLRKTTAKFSVLADFYRDPWFVQFSARRKINQAKGENAMIYILCLQKMSTYAFVISSKIAN